MKLGHEIESTHCSSVGLGSSDFNVVSLNVHALKLEAKVSLFSSSEFYEGIMAI